jgi:hypothetical protein
MRPPATLLISEDEESLIKTGMACEEFIQQPIWKELEKYLDSVVEEALDQMRGNQSSDPAVAHRFKLVWQEREAFRDRLILYVKGPIKAKKELLLQIEEEKKNGRSASSIY